MIDNSIRLPLESPYSGPSGRSLTSAAQSALMDSERKRTATLMSLETERQEASRLRREIDTLSQLVLAISDYVRDQRRATENLQRRLGTNASGASVELATPTEFDALTSCEDNDLDHGSIHHWHENADERPLQREPTEECVAMEQQVHWWAAAFRKLQAEARSAIEERDRTIEAQERALRAQRLYASQHGVDIPATAIEGGWQGANEWSSVFLPSH